LRGTGRFDTNHFSHRGAFGKGKRDAGQQPAAANRHEHHVSANLFGDFEADGALPRDYIGIV
jgi:hypothetical protein